MQTLRNELLALIAAQYGVQPDYPWDSTPDAAVLRHLENRKWFGLIMRVSYKTIGISRRGQTDILNLKCDAMMLGSVLMQKGFLPAYHMNKSSWLTVLLDGTVPLTEITPLLQMSFQLTKGKSSGGLRTEPKEWLIPANPKYYDIAAAFAKSDVIDWKQGNGVLAGDTVYMYVGAPVSAVLYACRVTQINIPYQYADEHLRIEKLMKIQLLHTFSPDTLPFAVLKEFGVYAVRGPRGIPDPLSEHIQMLTGGTI